MSIQKKELETFVKEGIITHAQMDHMLKYNESNSRTNFGDIVSKIILIGAVLFGFGVITLIATNWDSIPDALKITGVLLTILACYVGADQLRNRFDLPKVAEGVYLIGGLATGGLFALISQIYNIDTGNYSGLLIIWFVCVLVPTYIFNARMLTLLTAILFSASTCTFIMEHLRVSYEFKYISLVLLSQIVIFLIGGLHYKYKQYYEIGRLYRLSALTFGTISFLILTYSFDTYSTYLAPKSLTQADYLQLIIPIVVIFALTAYSYLAKVYENIYLNYANLLLVALSVLLFFNMTTDGDQHFLVFVLLNALYIISNIAIVYLSILLKDKTIMNFGVVIACVYIFTKAITWLSMLNGYVFFMSIGLIFILIGYSFERIRKELLTQIAK